MLERHGLAQVGSKNTPMLKKKIEMNNLLQSQLFLTTLICKRSLVVATFF
jgi:hypothetical protein